MIGFETHTNRYKDKQLFVHVSENKVLWFGNFKFCRISKNEDSDKIIMIDPSGGPYLEVGTSSKFIPGVEDTNKEIKSLKFSKDFTYVIIKLKDKDGK